jgi:uncharacterized protein (DUF4415 family)
MKIADDEAMAKELKALAELPDDKIDFSDIPATSLEFWAGAERGRFYRPRKEAFTTRLDADLLHWIKSKGKGYHTRLNALIRKAMLDELKHKH